MDLMIDILFDHNVVCTLGQRSMTDFDVISFGENAQSVIFKNPL